MPADPLKIAEHIVTKGDAKRLADVVAVFYQRLRKGGFDEDQAHEHAAALLDALLVAESVEEPEEDWEGE
jgi:hypothetical protein